MPVPRGEWVAKGPVPGTDWCVVDAPEVLLAPGRVVLCREGTVEVHPDAARAAQSAWDLLARWADQHRVPDSDR